MNRAPKSRYRLSHEGKLTWLTFGAAVPAVVVALALLWSGNYSAKLQWTLTILIVACFLGFISSAREHIVHPLRTMSICWPHCVKGITQSARAALAQATHWEKPFWKLT